VSGLGPRDKSDTISNVVFSPATGGFLDPEVEGTVYGQKPKVSVKSKKD